MRTVAMLCMLAAAVGGCGAASRDTAKDFKGQQRAVASTVEGLESAARKNDADKVCKQLLSASLLAALVKGGTTCTTAVKESFKDADSLDLAVDDVTISGVKAIAKVTAGRAGSKQGHGTLNLVRDGAAWKIASLGPTATG